MADTTKLNWDWTEEVYNETTNDYEVFERNTEMLIEIFEDCNEWTWEILKQKGDDLTEEEMEKITEHLQEEFYEEEYFM